MTGEGAITTVISDYGGVLTSPLAGAFAKINERHGLPETALSEAMMRAGERAGMTLLVELECGRLPEDDFLALLSAQLSADLGRELDLSQFSEHYFDGLEPNLEMLEALAAVRRDGYRMGLLTNNVREWGVRWRPHVPVDVLFDDVCDSSDVGLRKPDPAIYHLACERLGVTPQECVLVDDFAHNCEAARAVGMSAVRLHDTAEAIAQLRALLARRGAPPRASGAPTG